MFTAGKHDDQQAAACSPAPSQPLSVEQHGLSTSTSPLPQDAVGVANGHPRVLMLGMGWFPSTVGGLDRYYRSLFEQLPEASGVVIGHPFVLVSVTCCEALAV